MAREKSYEGIGVLLFGESVPGAEGVQEGGRDPLLLVEGDAVEKGKGEGALGEGFRDGKTRRGGAGSIEPGGLKVDGGKVTSSGDAGLGQCGLDAVAVCRLRQPNDVDEPADDAVWKG